MDEKSTFAGKGMQNEPERIFAQASSVGDSAAAVDELGFDLYVNAIADFLIAPNTRAPLTCSIEGSWGSGKSSFMLQLKNRLRAIDPNCRTIEFNAWKYDKQEELWAAFALKVTRSLRDGLKLPDRIRRDFHLLRTRIKGWSQRLSLLAFVAAWILLLIGASSIVYWTIQASHGERIKLVKALLGSKASPEDKNPRQDTPNPTQPSLLPLDPWYEFLSWSPLATAAVLIVLLVGKLPEGLRRHLFEAQLERYIDRPDYKGKAAFVDAFSEDFAKVLEAYAPPQAAKIFVFIDDLDRCEAPKAADLMQAINLMIGDGNPLIFILGLDRAKVASAIAFKFREIVPYLDASIPTTTASPDEIRSFGEAFLEKFIQLSFRLPISSNEHQARKFIDSLIVTSPTDSFASTDLNETEAANIRESNRRALRIESGAESERIRNVVMMVREVLGYSPRRIKTFLNAFRLALYIASVQGLLDVNEAVDKSEVTPEQLGKFLALTMRYPEFRSVVTQYPSFLYDLERLALGLPVVTSDKIPTSEWLQKPGIEKLLGFGIINRTLTVTWMRRYSMEGFPAAKFETILPSVPAPAERPQSENASLNSKAPTDSRPSVIESFNINRVGANPLKTSLSTTAAIPLNENSEDSGPSPFNPGSYSA